MREYSPEPGLLYSFLRIIAEPQCNTILYLKSSGSASLKYRIKTKILSSRPERYWMPVENPVFSGDSSPRTGSGTGMTELEYSVAGSINIP
jgi:hypothetical protein